MKTLLKTLTVTTLSLAATNIFAASPQKLITHNLTNVDSNAYVSGNIPSRHPTKAHTTGKVSWTEVKMACFGHLVEGRCASLVRMAVNTPNPIDLGWVSLDLKTGDITPKELKYAGYKLIVNGPGETTLIEDDN